jgi:CHAD domain-containing protein
MRAALGLFRHAMTSPDAQRETRALGAEAKWLAAACAPARDLHVFLTETVEDPSATVRRIAGRLAATHFERARSALAGATFEGFERQLMSFIDSSPASQAGRLDAFGRATLERRHGQVVHRAHKLEKLDGERLHRLRISLKKLRYAAEFLRPAFASPAAKPYIQATARLQGALGTLNDRAVAGQMIADIAAAARPTEDVTRELRSLAKEAASGEKGHRQRLQRAWKTFKKAEPFWVHHETGQDDHDKHPDRRRGADPRHRADGLPRQRQDDLA